MTLYNEHMRLAQAMLAGHLYVEPPPWEHVVVHGHAYILHPPLSALLCIPFAAVGFTDQQRVSWLLAAITITLAWRATKSLWLTALYVLGTTFLYESYIGASWNFALVASLPFTFLALSTESPIFTGVFAGLAALARYDLILAFPAYLYIKRDWRVLLGAGLWGGVYVWFNEMRFGTLTDIALNEWYKVDQYHNVAVYGPFSVHYIPFAVYTLLFLAPRFSSSFPWYRPTFLGQSLLTLSPGLLLGLRANSYTAAAVLCSIPSLTVYASGFSQLGCRYYTQVIPFLILSIYHTKLLSDWDKGLIVLSIVLTTYFTTTALLFGLAQ